eukprot:scaffold273224_cov18-Prasinocladus_malaysianus.AAC.1
MIRRVRMHISSNRADVLTAQQHVQTIYLDRIHIELDYLMSSPMVAICTLIRDKQSIGRTDGR